MDTGRVSLWGKCRAFYKSLSVVNTGVESVLSVCVDLEMCVESVGQGREPLVAWRKLE